MGLICFYYDTEDKQEKKTINRSISDLLRMQ